MACASSCKTQDHATFGECVRSQGQMVGYCRSATDGGDYSAQKAWDSELALYKSAREQGVQPSSTKRHAVERALEISDRTGTAYDAG